MILIIISLVAIAITGCICSYKIGQKNVTIEREQENKAIRELNQHLQDVYQEKQYALKELEQKLSEALKENDKKCREAMKAYADLTEKLALEFKDKEIDYMLKETEMSHKLGDIKDIKFSRINDAATQYRHKLYEEIKAETAAAMIAAEKAKTLVLKECEEIAQELEELIMQRDALIEAHKHEEETRLQQNFYKIILDENDLDDIKMLLSIEKFLNNKDPLYKLIWSNFYMIPVKDTLNRIIGKEKTSGIYKITNQIDGRIYIGQSVDLHNRLTNHIKAALGIGTIAHQLVHDAMAADGIENFTFEIVDKCPKDQLNKKEKLWIETYASNKYGYNRTAGGAKED